MIMKRNCFSFLREGASWLSMCLVLAVFVTPMKSLASDDCGDEMSLGPNVVRIFGGPKSAGSATSSNLPLPHAQAELEALNEMWSQRGRQFENLTKAEALRIIFLAKYILEHPQYIPFDDIDEQSMETTAKHLLLPARTTIVRGRPLTASDYTMEELTESLWIEAIVFFDLRKRLDAGIGTLPAGTRTVNVATISVLKRGVRNFFKDRGGSDNPIYQRLMADINEAAADLSE